MNTSYEWKEELVARIMAEKRAARAARLAQRRAEAQRKHERVLADWREHVCMYHVFVNLSAGTFFVEENVLSKFDCYIDNPNLYHCVVRGWTRARTVAGYVTTNPGAALEGANVIALAFAHA